MKRTAIILFLCSALFVRASDTLRVKKHYRKIYFFTAGLQAYSDEYLRCDEIQAAKMGFGHKRKAGCVIGPIKWWRIETHNKRVERKLVRRFGSDWRKRYEALTANCD